MKKKSLLLFPLVGLFLGGCNLNVQQYVKSFFFYCNLNGGSYTQEFLDEHSEGEFSGDQFRANLNLNYFQGALNIMPTGSEMTKEGKVFAGWYFDEACSPSKVVSEYSMHQIVMNYENLERKSTEVYARWIDADKIDVILELDFTKVNKKSEVNTYADHIIMGADFAQEYKTTNSEYIDGKVFRKTYSINQLQSLYQFDIIPTYNDVTIADSKYMFAGAALPGYVNEDYDNCFFSKDEDLKYLEGCFVTDSSGTFSQSVLPSKVNSLVNIEKMHQLILVPQYFIKPYVNICFHTNYTDQSGESHSGIPGEFTTEAQAKFDATLIKSTYRSSTSYEVNLQFFTEKLFGDTDATLNDTSLKALAPVKSDFTVNDISNWDDYTLQGWKLLEPVYEGEGGTRSDILLKDFSVSYLKEKVNKFGESWFEAVVDGDYVYPVAQD